MSLVPIGTRVEMKLALGWSAERIVEELGVTPRFVAEVALYLEMLNAADSTDLSVRALRSRIRRVTA